jgi:hypothetical protein
MIGTKVHTQPNFKLRFEYNVYGGIFSDGYFHYVVYDTSEFPSRKVDDCISGLSPEAFDRHVVNMQKKAADMYEESRELTDRVGNGRAASLKIALNAQRDAAQIHQTIEFLRSVQDKIFSPAP